MNRASPTATLRPRTRPRGFSLLEVLVALTVVSVVMAALLLTFTRMETLSETQLTITEVQQSARAAHDEVLRMVRMAGRGGLQQDRAALGRALLVRNNVGLSTEPRAIADSADAPLAVEGTDVVVVRGVLTTNLLAVDYRDRSTSDYDSGSGVGTLVVSAKLPTGRYQDLSVLLDAAAAGTEEALVLIDAIDSSTYGVAQLVPSSVTGDAGGVRLRFETQSERGEIYAQLSRNFDGEAVFPDLNAVAFVGVLEEYRYYVREAEDLGPTLARARLYPNTEEAYAGDDEQLAVDYATGVVDLQVALAFDSAHLGAIDDDDDAEGTDDEIVEHDRDNSEDDDWLFNQPSDDVTDEMWSGPWLPDEDATLPRPTLFAVRVSTLAMAGQIERGHPSPLLPGLEDHDYDTDADDPINGDPHRLKRKRLLQTVIKPRNL